MTISKQSRLSRWREFAQGLTVTSNDSAISELATRCGVSRSIGSALKWAELFDGQPKGSLFNLLAHNSDRGIIERLCMKALRDYNRYLELRRRERNARISQNMKVELSAYPAPNQQADHLDEKTAIAFLKARGYEIFKTERIQY